MESYMGNSQLRVALSSNPFARNNYPKLPHNSPDLSSIRGVHSPDYEAIVTTQIKANRSIIMQYDVMREEKSA